MPHRYRVLELFSGAGSVRHFCAHMPSKYTVVTLDINPVVKPDICTDILKWNYKLQPQGTFDVIWASPDCTSYSHAATKTDRDMHLADSLVKRTLQIIQHFKPRFWFIENPQTGLLKTRPFVKNLPFYDVCYCEYNFPYQKPTRIWTNVQGFKPRWCTHQNRHTWRLGRTVPGHNEHALTTHVPHWIRSLVPQRLLQALFKQAGLPTPRSVQDMPDWSKFFSKNCPFLGPPKRT